MKEFTRRLQQVIGTALILAFFSEFYFLNEGPVNALVASIEENPFTAVFGFLELIAYYGLFAYPMLICIGHFRISNWAGLILAASIYGLAAEALVVPVVYEAIPYSIIWTSLSWHTLIDVLFGWYLLRWTMRARTIWPSVVALALAGVFWGGWATWFWGETPEIALSQSAFVTMALVTTFAMMIGMILADRAPLTTFNATRIEIIALAIVSSVFFAFTGWPYFPLPIAILALFGLILFGLSASRLSEGKNMLERLDQPAPWPRYLVLPVLPTAAIATYSYVLKSGFQIATEDVVLLILAAGALSFLTALARLFWRRSKT